MNLLKPDQQPQTLQLPHIEQNPKLKIDEFTSTDTTYISSLNASRNRFTEPGLEICFDLD